MELIVFFWIYLKFNTGSNSTWSVDWNIQNESAPSKYPTESLHPILIRPFVVKRVRIPIKKHFFFKKNMGAYKSGRSMRFSGISGTCGPGMLLRAENEFNWKCSTVSVIVSTQNVIKPVKMWIHLVIKIKKGF